ncbi:MAG: hypothetical protein JKY65_19045 [Planctomycetes bacterium]|nr:hypothetical protein [Planctomycetota bacterium]
MDSQSESQPTRAAKIQTAHERARLRLARLEKRHGGSWSLGPTLTISLFAVLLAFVPWALLQVMASDGSRTSPGLRGLVVVAGVLAALTCLVGYRVSTSKLWRAKRRAPWFLLRFRRGEPVTCAFCRDDLGSRTGQTSCDSCGAAYHADCQEELGFCATLGCTGLGERRQRVQTGKLTLKDPSRA